MNAKVVVVVVVGNVERMLAVWDVVMKTVCSGVSVSSGWCVLYCNGRGLLGEGRWRSGGGGGASSVAAARAMRSRRRRRRRRRPPVGRCG